LKQEKKFNPKQARKERDIKKLIYIIRAERERERERERSNHHENKR
jgi:hypothetical protein